MKNYLFFFFQKGSKEITDRQRALGHEFTLLIELKGYILLDQPIIVMQISRKSTITGKFHTLEIDVTQEQIDRWEAGELIQNAMPHLPRHEREFIKTGITGEEWNQYFGNNEEDKKQ